MSSIRRVVVAAATTLAVLALAPGAAHAAKYVALGDSFSSGSGNVSDLDWACTRSTKAFPYQVALQRPDLQLTFVACGGAVTSDVLNTQIRYVTPDTKVVSISIGGNDVGFANLIAGCLSFYCQYAIDDTNRKIDQELPAKLDAVYAAIRQHAPDAKVVVMGYPRMFGPKTCTQSSGADLNEQQQLNGVADHLAAVISARAAAAGFAYGNAIPVFTGHDVCGSPAWLYGTYASVPYHPNVAGHHDGLAPLLRSFIG